MSLSFFLTMFALPVAILALAVYLARRKERKRP